MTRQTRCSFSAFTNFLLGMFVTLFVVTSASAQSAPADEAPADEAPADEAPADEVPADEAPADEAPADSGEPVADAPPEPVADPLPPTATGPGVPVNLTLRRLEQRVQALKERAWRAKARVGMLKEAVLGGGVGARAEIKHVNKMGNSYRLLKLVYALDGAQVFARNDPSGALHSEDDFDVLTGPIAPGSHTISVLALYRGHGYGVFKYLKKYKFKA